MRLLKRPDGTRIDDRRARLHVPPEPGINDALDHVASADDGEISDADFERRTRRRRRLWLAIALVVAVVGSGCSLWAASGVANQNAARSRAQFTTTAAEVASNLQVANQHEQDLLAHAAGYLSLNPDSTDNELAQWASVVQVWQRYPELLAVGEVVSVPAAQLPSFALQLASDAPTGLRGVTPLQIVPPGNRDQYCLARAGIARDQRLTLPAGYDFCSGDFAAAAQASRDSGHGAYLPFQLGGTGLLVIMTPTYTPGAPVDTITERRAAFLGWVGSVIEASNVLDQALIDYPHTAATLSYQDAQSTVHFSSGPAVSTGARSTTVTLDSDWSVRIFGATASAVIVKNPVALALLAAGVALSLLLAALILVLATTRLRAWNLVRQRTHQLQFQALHDALTGLPNRLLIHDRITQLLTRNNRNGTLAAALYLDLDGFKTINDSLGHAAGDQLLRAVTLRLQETLREADTIGRVGGDEFVILTDAASHPGGPDVVAERVLQALTQPFDLAGVLTPITITASIGIAIGHDQPPGELLRQADTALYQAKAAGRNCAITYRPQMSTDVQHRF